MKHYKKEKLIQMIQIYLFDRNLQFQKFIKTSPSVLPGCGTRTKLICAQPTSSPTTTQWLGKHHTLANSNLHQALTLCFMNFILCLFLRYSQR